MGVRKNLGANDAKLQTALERLSSGLRVNSAKDDAAGQSIGNRMSNQVRGNAQAARNAADGVSLAQTTEGALDGITLALQRVRELSVQGLSGTLSPANADAIQQEINLNLKEIDRLVAQSNFNGIHMLDGSREQVVLQVGASDGDQLAMEFPKGGLGVEALGLKDFTIAGINGKIKPLNVLEGQAVNIRLNDASTATTYPVGSVNAKLVLGNNDIRYIQSEGVNGRPLFYQAGVSAHYDSASSSSKVNVSAVSGLIYSEPTSLAAKAVPNASTFRDENGALYVDGATRQLVNADGSYWIKATDAFGDETYTEAAVSYNTSGAATVRAKNAATNDGTGFIAIAPVTSLPATDLATATIDLQDSLGNPLASADARLMRANNNNAYMLEVRQADGTYQYFNAMVDVTSDGATSSVRVRATSATPARSFTDVDAVSGTSTVTLDARNVQVQYTDSNGAVYNDRLRMDDNGEYYIAVSDGENSYKRAVLTTNQDGDLLIKTWNGAGELVLYYPLKFQAGSNGGSDFSLITIDEDSPEIRVRQPEDPLAALDRALASVDTVRGKMGALQNRLDAVVSSLTVTSNNLSTARSRIMDADYAAEVSNMMKAQIIQQAGTSLLAQANQAPQAVLRLLQ